MKLDPLYRIDLINAAMGAPPIKQRSRGKEGGCRSDDRFRRFATASQRLAT
jgi:hypothetical protein